MIASIIVFVSVFLVSCAPLSMAADKLFPGSHLWWVGVVTATFVAWWCTNKVK